jgi:glycosyltransferase involved in cell wall biosynthesis
MKRKFQLLIKHILDVLFSPLLIMGALIARIIPKKNIVRALIGLSPNNNLIYLRDSLNKIGYNSQVIPWIIPNHEKENIDYNLNINDFFPRLYSNFFGQLLLIYCFFLWSLFNFDLYIMPFQNRLLDRTGFLKWFEFQLLFLARKKIILNPYGGDIQFPEVWQASSDKAFKQLHKAWMEDGYYSKTNSEKTKKNNKYCTKWANALIISLEWPDYLEKGHYNYFHMRCVPSAKAPSEVSVNNKIFTILHATNHGHFKGTQYLEEAVASINKNQKICNLIILKNTPNQEVLELIKEADVVFDQILLGAYGRLAIEAMSLGKPVLCYLREDLKEFYPNWAECPIVNANIDNIKEKIIELMKMSQEERNAIGKQSLNYVNKYHSSEYVGDKLHQIIQKVLNS